MENGQKQLNRRLAMFCLHSHPLGRLGTRDTGGMSVYICHLALELGKSGYSVDIFTPFNGLYREKIMILGTNVRLVHIAVRKNHHLNQEAVYLQVDEFIRGIEAFRSGSGLTYDIIHSHYWLSGLAGLRAREKWARPHVITFHTIRAIRREAEPVSNISGFRLRCEKELINACDLVVSLTAQERCDISRVFRCPPSKISVIECGVDFAAFYPFGKEKARKALGLTDNEVMLLYVGRIDPMKRVGRLLGAAALLNRKVKVFIVGGDPAPGPEQRQLYEMAEKLGISDRLVFSGSLPQKDLPLYYSGADVFVFPSRYESFGLAGLESLACGTPVLATGVGVFPEILTGTVNGRLLPDADPVLMAGKIREVLTQSRKTEDVTKKIRNSVRQYTWARTARKMSSAYETLIRQEESRNQIHQ
ncbi:MAG: glycosyltransferase [Desulfobacterales bacterium]|nr:glycosyltransferase [Desulfobacterales bacterium]